MDPVTQKLCYTFNIKCPAIYTPNSVEESTVFDTVRARYARLCDLTHDRAVSSEWRRFVSAMEEYYLKVSGDLAAAERKLAEIVGTEPAAKTSKKKAAAPAGRKGKRAGCSNKICEALKTCEVDGKGNCHFKKLQKKLAKKKGRR